MNEIEKRYLEVKELYASFGIDTNKALETLSSTSISIHCWQGDDVQGFLKSEGHGGGIQATGNYPYKATNPQELRNDLDVLLSLVPGKFKLNLHAIYAESETPIQLDQVEPKHFANWLTFAKKHNLGLDYNPTCFSHPNASTGFYTLKRR
jgi:L-rhamnose isomerase